MAILVLLNRNQDVPRRLFRDRRNPLDYLSDDAVISDYRLDRRTIYELCDTFEGELERPTQRSMSLPVSLQIMIASRYFASGSYMSVIGEAHGVSKMSVSRAVKSCTGLITRHLDKYITFPLDIQEQVWVKRDFYNIRGFPSVLGAVDGTLIPIETPSIDEYHYVCRKGYHALNVQGVCDAKLKFLNIVAKWPGATHDSFIWNSCGLCAAFENKEITGGWLLGDSGYGLRPWLLTPKLNRRTPGDRKYNAYHKSTRCVIERAFGLWKMRFRCIYRPLHLAPERAVAVVIATAILHNICIEKNLPLPEINGMDDDDDNDEAIYNTNGNDNDSGNNVREELISRVFS